MRTPEQTDPVQAPLLEPRSSLGAEEPDDDRRDRRPAPAENLFVWAKGGSTSYVTDATARGVRYEIGTDGLVKAVRAGGPSIQLVEGCS